MVNFVSPNISLTIMEILTEFGPHYKDDLKKYFPRVNNYRLEEAFTDLLRRGLIYYEQEKDDGKINHIFYAQQSPAMTYYTQKALTVLRWMFQLKVGEKYLYCKRIKYATISAFPETLIIGFNGVVHLMYIGSGRVDETVALVNELDLRDEIKDSAVKRILIVDNADYLDKISKIKGVINILQVTQNNKIKKLK